MRAGVPIVPIAVVGAEEAMPIFAQIGSLKRLTGLIYFPITPLFPHRPARRGYLPAKFKHPLPRAGADGPDGRASRGTTTGLVQDVAQDIRARIQEELFDMVGERDSVWFG